MTEQQPGIAASQPFAAGDNHTLKLFAGCGLALVAVAISYRGKSAIRDVAKALGLPPDQVKGTKLVS